MHGASDFALVHGAILCMQRFNLRRRGLARASKPQIAPLQFQFRAHERTCHSSTEDDAAEAYAQGVNSRLKL